MGEDRTGATGADRRRLTVPQAAEALGVTVDAVRGRIRRGKLKSEHHAGAVYVWLDAPEEDDSRGASPTSHRPSDDQSERIEDFREQVAYLREQLEAERQAHAEARRLLMAALERIAPQLEAPQKPAAPPVSPAAPGKDRTEGGEGTEVGSPSQLEFGSYLRVAAFSLVVLIGLSIGAILVDAALREAPYIDPWAYAAGALCLFPIGFGFAFGYLTVGNLTPRIGASALLVVLPSALLMIVVGAALLGYAGITVVRLLYSIPMRAFDPEVVLIPAGVSLSGAMFFLFSALVGHALHRQGADESGVSAHALTPLQQAIIGVLGAFITAVFSFCGVLVQVFFASSGTP